MNCNVNYGNIIKKGNILLLVTKCPAYEDYDVFGVDRKGCCFKYHEFCDKVESCEVKKMIYKFGNEGIERSLGVEFKDEESVV